tara:strand:+ start:4535 stop:6892 length:2358 start_codon:yes stop_codon:yes gene_type:complete
MSLENLFNSLQNLLSGGKDQPQEEEKQTEGLMSTSLRPRARPAGLKPIETEQNENNEYLANTINNINSPEFNEEDTTVKTSLRPKARPAGVPLNSVDAQDVLSDPSTLYSVYNTRMAKADSNFSVKMQKFKSAELDSLLKYAEEKEGKASAAMAFAREALNVSLRPKARPYQVGEAKEPDYTFTEKDRIKEIQQDLNAAGITVNGKKLVVDGIKGDNTEKAIMAFQKREGLKVDGIVGDNTKAAFRRVIPQSAVEVGEIPDQQGLMKRLPMAAEAYEVGDIPMIIGETDQSTKEGRKRIQEALNELGYDVGKVDGIFGSKTKKQIQKFKKDNDLLDSLTIDKDTVNALNDARGVTMGGDTETPSAVSSGIFNFKMPQSKLLNLATGTPAKLLIKNILGLDRNYLMKNIPIPITEAAFKEDELQHFRNMWTKYGTGKVTKAQQIDSANAVMNVITGKDRAPFDLPADVRAYYSVGDFTLTQNEDGEVILKDQYDYNIYTDYTAEPTTNKDGEQEYPRLTTEEFEDKYSTARGIKDTLKAYTDGKIGFMSAAHNLGFLLGSRDYKDASKDEGTPIRINLGKPETWDTDNADAATAGLMSPTTQPKAIPEGQELKVNNLTIVNATRGDGKAYRGTKNMFNISLDYNSHTSYASGTEVIIPDNADEATRKAADKFNKAMVAFAKKHGIKGYKNRGIFTTTQNAARKGGERGGADNTIHAEPFFIQDKKMVAAVKNNFKEFSQIYVDTFGSLPARIVAPHGVEGDVGKVSEEFGSELEFGKSVIATLMRS